MKLIFKLHLCSHLEFQYVLKPGRRVTRRAPWSLTFRKEHSFRKCRWQTGVPLNVTVTQIVCGVAVIVVGLCVVWFDDFICRYHLHIEKQCNGFKKVLGFMIFGFSQLSCSNCHVHCCIFDNNNSGSYCCNANYVHCICKSSGGVTRSCRNCNEYCT